MRKNREMELPAGAPVMQAIEDAVMFGKNEDLAAILDAIADDDSFPAELRHGLESLHYFRSHYGAQGVLPEADKQKVALMDTTWSAELLEMMRDREMEPAAKQA